jgi:hypothetical protein
MDDAPPSFSSLGMSPAEGQASHEGRASSGGRRRQWPPQIVLFLTFATFYFAIGPGNFFSTDEVRVEETAQALLLRHTLDIPVMNDSRLGRAQSYYTVNGPGFPFAALPFVYLGLKFDDAFGSMNGGPLAGPPIGVEEQPLRWGGRLTISASLMANTLVGGGIVALLSMAGIRLSGNPRAAFLMAIAAGVSTLVMSEATHFFQHGLCALMLIAAFWFFGGQESETLGRRALFGGLSLGLAVLSRPNAGPSAIVLWLYGMAAAWKLVGDLPDRWRRAICQGLLAAAGPAAAVVGYLYFNYLKFGSITNFGYKLGDATGREGLVVNAAQMAQAIAAYLLSPALSIFLFAPPLILALAVGRRMYHRWPLETIALLAASVVHLLSISLIRDWTGDVCYGPRYMLEAIVLLMPLTLPAFEAIANSRSRRVAIAIGGVVLLGIVVQLIGVAVYPVINEWRRGVEGIAEDGAFVFVPHASPIVYGLQELLAGRNLSPWALRAFAQPGWTLMLLFGLIAIVWVGGRRLIGYLRAPEEEVVNVSSDRFAGAIVLAAMLPILFGFAIARPIMDPPSIHAFKVFEAGLAAQGARRPVAAAEDYAIVLGLSPSDKFARYNLGILEQDAGRVGEALALYASVLGNDPAFTPARLRIGSLRQAGGH